MWHVFLLNYDLFPNFTTLPIEKRKNFRETSVILMIPHFPGFAFDRPLESPRCENGENLGKQNEEILFVGIYNLC